MARVELDYDMGRLTGLQGAIVELLLRPKYCSSPFLLLDFPSQHTKKIFFGFFSFFKLRNFGLSDIKLQLYVYKQDQKSIDAIKAIVYFNNLNIQEI